MHRTTGEKLIAVGQAARPATLQLKFIRQRETFANYVRIGKPSLIF